MIYTLILDIASEKSEIDLSECITFDQSLQQIIILQRHDQHLESIPDLATVIQCDPVQTEVQRAAIGLRHVTHGAAVYTCGSVVQRISTGQDVTRPNSNILACGRVDRYVQSQSQRAHDTGSQVRSFYVAMDKYISLRGFNPRFKTLDNAIREFAYRCELMGWQVASREPVFELYGSTPSIYATSNTQEATWEATEKTALVANIPQWKYRPFMAAPLVTVAISTYNRSGYLKAAIQSVLAQTFQDFEIVIVDDGSQDDTAEVVAEIHDDRVIYSRIENSGIAGARNHAAALSKGFFTAVHDSDDLMLPERIADGLASLHDDRHASYGAWVNFDNSSAEMVMHVTKLDFDLDIVANNGQTPGHPTWLIPTQVIRDLQYDTRLTSAVDHNLAVRSAMVGLKWSHVGRAVMLRRIHEGQVSMTDSGHQKVAALLTRQFSVNGRSVSSELEGIERATKRKWPDIAEKKNLDHFFRRYLPDELADRIVEVSGPIASKIGILTNFQDDIGIAAELNGSGDVRTERAWVHNPSWEALGKLATAGYNYTLRSATLEVNTNAKVETWLLGRMRNLTKSNSHVRMWMFAAQGRASSPPDSARLGFYCRYESGAENMIFGAPVTNSTEVAKFRAGAGDFEPFLIASESIDDVEILNAMGVISQ